MAEHELDALVVRAPDNVLYLTNFWGMKGYDAVVFPQEGEPVLICLEASEADAERMSWTPEVRLFRGYDESDPRPPSLRALDLARQISSDYDRVGIELSLGTQAADRMVGEPTTYPKAWFDAFPEAADATPLLATARAIKTEQEIERMRLANAIAAGAMEHVQARLRTGMRESEVGAMWNSWVHDHGTGFDHPAYEGTVELALRLLAHLVGPGIRSFTATGSRPIQEHAPTLFEIWVCADGYWCDHTKNLVPGELDARYAELEEQLMACLRGCGRLLSRPVRASRSSTGASGKGWPEPAIEGQPSHPDLPRRRRPRARAALCPSGRRRYDRGRNGARTRARRLLARGWRPSRRGQLPDHRRRAGEALPLPRRDRARSVIDRDQLWTGELNQRALEPQTHDTVGLYDTTLRDGEQTVGVVLSPEDKLAIARALDEAGVDRIEAGFARVSEEDAEAIRLIAAAGLQAEVWGFARAVQADVEQLAGLGVSAAVIESPISDAKLAALGVSHDDMLGRIRKAVSFAAGEGITVAFFGVDGSRAELGFFRRAYEAAVEAGAKEAVVVDTIGVATPEGAAYLVGQAVDWLDVPVHWHGHDDFGLATAAAVAAVQAGATWVHGTVNGMGERAGNANLLEVALALEALYGIPTRLDLTKARELAALVQKRSGYHLAPWTPITGANLFTRESGAVASQFHDPPSIEPYAAGLVGADRGDRAREEERARLDPAEGRGARARPAGGAVPGGPGGRETARNREKPARHRRRVPCPGRERSLRWRTTVSS